MSVVYQTKKFCSCTPAPGTPTTSNPCDDCVIAYSFPTDCTTSTGPGGESGTLDLAAVNNYSGCVDSGGSACTLTYTLLSYDATALTNVAISSSGILSWDTTNDAVPDSFAEVEYIASCDCNLLSSRATISICIRDLCENRWCSPGEVCNPLTGLCEPVSPDVEIL